MRNLLILAAVFLLQGCLGSTFVEAPAQAKIECEEPVFIPERAITDQEVEILWGRDRTSLRVCEKKRGALLGVITGDVPEDIS